MTARQKPVSASGDDRRESRRRLREREFILRQLGDALPALVVVSRPHGDDIAPVFYNHRWEEYTGLDQRSLMQGLAREHYHPDDLAPSIADTLRARSAVGERLRYDARFRRHDGVYRWHTVLIEPICETDGSLVFVVGIAVDVHDERTARAELEDRERLLRLANEAAGTGVWSHDLVNDTVVWSDEIRAIMGFEPGAHITSRVLLRIAHPDDRVAILAVVERSTDPAGDGAINIEHRIIRSDGEIRWVAVRGEVQFAGDPPRAVRSIGTMVDTTGQHRLIDDLRHASAVKDEFLGLVSHELRTPLTAIIGLGRHLSRHADRLGPESREALADLNRYSQRLHDTVENMLLLTRLDRQSVETEPLLVQHIVRRIAAQYRERNLRRVIELDIAPGLPPVEGHAGWLGQVIENLISNADKYSPEDTAITVTARHDGDSVFIAVADRGPGIPAGEVERIFEPFYRSESTAIKPGAGLGLTVCHRLLQLQGGTIDVCPRPGGGAIFTVHLPVCKPADPDDL